jgi:heterodisulfide reductase subunit B
MRFGLFLGCSVPVRAQNYEASVRRVAPGLGVELEDLEGASCCGYPVQSVSRETALAMAARNLALAGRRGLDVCVLCSACGGSLMEAASELDGDDGLRARTNRHLEPEGLSYEGGVKVLHVAEVLAHRVGADRIRERVTRPLEGLRIAVHYGCHYLRPRETHACGEDPEVPGSIDALVEATGARSVDYPGRLTCCGGGILGIDEQTALAITRGKLDAVSAEAVDAMVVVCPFCSVMFEGNQKRIEKAAGTEYKLPVLYYPQLLGLALGFGAKELGMQLNRIKAKDLIARVGA